MLVIVFITSFEIIKFLVQPIERLCALTLGESSSILVPWMLWLCNIFRDESLNFLLEDVVLSFFHDEWNRGGVEKIVTFDIKVCFRKHIEINLSISEMFVSSTG